MCLQLFYPYMSYSVLVDNYRLYFRLQKYKIFFNHQKKDGRGAAEDARWILELFPLFNITQKAAFVTGSYTAC